MVARDGNFYFRKMSLGTGFSACNCLFDSRNCLLTSLILGSYYKLPKSDSNAVYLLPNAVYLLQCCFVAANIVWAGHCDNSLFSWKLDKINLTARQTINTAIKISMNVNWCCKGWVLLFQKNVIGHRF